MNTVEEKSLRQPVKVEIDPDLIFEATTFRPLHRYGQYHNRRHQQRLGYMAGVSDTAQ